MRQRRAARNAQTFSLLTVLCAILCACDRTEYVEVQENGAAATTVRSAPTIVSLVPAATDLILGMEAGSHLVAVSNWDAERPEIRSLPRVGDYRTIDWEKISQLKPSLMIVQFREDKMPRGLRERAAAHGIAVVNVTINRLEDVFDTMNQIGDAIGEQSKANAASNRLRAQLDSVRERVSKGPPVSTLIARTQTGTDVVGGGNFMDDLLTVAGGKNVIEAGDNSYPTIDRERLVALNPEVILQVIPGATPQEIEHARQFWQTLPQVSAVRNDRVHVLTDSYLLLPGFSAGRIAETFASKLHPEAGK